MAIRKSWEQSIEGWGYIWSLSVNSDLMAVLGPVSRQVVHIIDAGTGKRKKEMLADWSISSVAVTTEKQLLFAGRPKGQREPGIWISPIEQDEIEPLPFHFVEEPPAYDEKILFGKIALVPNEKQALVAGISDRYDSKGFLLLADWSSGTDKGQVSLFRKEIDEAPHDIAIREKTAYIATGRGGTIEVFNIENRQNERTLIGIPGRPFKPMRVVTTEKYVVAASNDELFWWLYQEEPEGHELLSDYPDCINGLAALEKDTVVCTLTYSSILKLKDLLSSTTATSLQVDLKHPCYIITDPAHRNDFYTVGHSNGRILAHSLTPTPGVALVS